jgi:hypothetical protein
MCLLPPASLITLMMEAVSISTMFVYFNKTTQHIPEGHLLLEVYENNTKLHLQKLWYKRTCMVHYRAATIKQATLWEK